jgi:hypothetical protein
MSNDTNCSMLSTTEHKLVNTSVHVASSTTSGKENNPLLSANAANNSTLNCSYIISSSYFNTSDIKYNQMNFSK